MKATLKKRREKKAMRHRQPDLFFKFYQKGYATQTT